MEVILKILKVNFKNQLNIQDDRSLEDENQVDLVEHIQDEEIVLN